MINKRLGLELQPRAGAACVVRYRLAINNLNYKNYHLAGRLAKAGLQPRLTRIRSSSLAHRSYWDTDEYELDLGYESDDYSWPHLDDQPVQTGVTSTYAQQSSLNGTSTLGLQSENSYQTGITAQDDEVHISTKMTPRAASPTLTATVCKAAFELMQRIRGALLATGSAILLLLGHAGHQGSLHVRALRVKACKSLRKTKAGARMQAARQRAQTFAEQLPEGFWGKLLWLWERPPVQKLRLTWSLANISIKLPAVLALVATQVGLLASQVSLPMLAPLLLGTGMLLRSIKSNASFLFPRIGLFVVLAWLLWFANSVIQSTAAYLRKQGAIDNRMASAIITASECSALLGALLILLSMLGVNIGSALLLPAGIAVAIAAKDLSHNWLAGFFLFVAQPFRMGDRVAVSFSSPGAPGAFTSNWFEGVCEKIDLRYTSIRQGSRRLMVPNSAFITREFMILDDVPANSSRAGSSSSEGFLPTHPSARGAGPTLNGGHMEQYSPQTELEFMGAGEGGVDEQQQDERQVLPAWNPMQHMMAAGPYHAEVAAAAAASGAGHEQEPSARFQSPTPASPSTPSNYDQSQQPAHQQQQQQRPVGVNGSSSQDIPQGSRQGGRGGTHAQLVGVDGLQDGYPTTQPPKMPPQLYMYAGTTQRHQQQQRAQVTGRALPGYPAAGSSQLPGGVPGYYYDPSLHAGLWLPQQQQQPPSRQHFQQQPHHLRQWRQQAQQQGTP